MYIEPVKQLYAELKKRGYPEEFCAAITREMHTEFTSKRMLGYLAQFPTLPMEEIVDEMLAILSDRNAWIQKKESERAQQTINEFLQFGLGTEDDEDSED